MDRHLEDLETYGADGEEKRAKVSKEFDGEPYQGERRIRWDKHI